MAQKRKDKKGRVLRDNEYQRKDGSYEYKYVDSYGKRHSVYSWKLVETDSTPAGKRCDSSLREKEREIEQQMKDGINVSKSKNVTLNDMFCLHMEITELSDSTRENYQYMWKRFISSGIGTMKITVLRKTDILKFYASEKKKGLKNGTIQIFQKMIHPSLQLAVEDHLIKNNPSENCTRDYPEGDTEKAALSVEEEQFFLDYVKKRRKRQRYELLFPILFGTACRIGEIIGLTWENVNMKERTITIDHALVYRKKNGKTQFYATKTKTVNGIRVIPMTEEVYLCFKELQRTRFQYRSVVEIDGYKDFVFTSMKGKPLYPANINKMLYKMVNEINSDEENKIPHMSNHIFRHTGCTRMAEAEIDINTIQYIMGHSDYKMILKTYDHVNTERAKKQMKKLDNMKNNAG